MNEPTKIPLFRRWVLQNFPFIEQDFDALTDYQLICKVVEYLNAVITQTNATTEQVAVLTDAFNQLKDYVDHYFENLDVQEEINNKLDAMVEDGTLQEIIYEFLQSNVAWVFDTVADMKLATNLINGSYARTLGFHSVNDGGGAIYKITSTGTANEMDVIAIGDLYATLIKPPVLNPEIYGAYGDGVHDDATVLQYVFDLHIPVRLTKTYKTTATINLYDWNYINIDAEGSTINYTGNNVAFFIYHIFGGDIKFGRVTADNGGCIKFSSVDGVNDRVIYVNVKFGALTASGRCVEIETENNGYVSEIRFYGGQIGVSEYGFYIDNKVTVGGAGSEGLYFYNIGFEGSSTNYYINSPNRTITGLSMFNDRFVENNTNTVLKIDGAITRLYAKSWSNLLESRLDLTGTTSIAESEITCPIMNSANTAYFAEGIYWDRFGKKMYRHLLYSAPAPTLTSDVTAGTVKLEYINGLCIIRLNGITSTKHSYDIVSTANPLPSRFIPADSKQSCCVTADGETAQFWVRNNGSIAFSGDANGHGKAFTGEVIYYSLESNS